MIRNVTHAFASLKPPRLIHVKVSSQGEVNPFAFPVHTKLAKNLQKAGVPLQFQCGYACKCSTCAVEFTPGDFKKITKDQPIQQNQKKTLQENGKIGENVRLSCQLFVMDYFEGMVIKCVQEQ